MRSDDKNPPSTPYSEKYPAQTSGDPAFRAWADGMPDKHWAKYDIGACAIGWDAGVAWARSAIESTGAADELIEWIAGQTMVQHCTPAWCLTDVQIRALKGKCALSHEAPINAAPQAGDAARTPGSTMPKGSRGIFEPAVAAPLSSTRPLEEMPTDAVIREICKWRGLDAGDKIDRADASGLWHAIQQASPSATRRIPDEVEKVLKDWRLIDRPIDSRMAACCIESAFSVATDGTAKRKPGYMGDVNGPGCDPDVP